MADSQSVLYTLQSTLSQVIWGGEHIGTQVVISSHVLCRLRIERLDSEQTTKQQQTELNKQSLIG